MSKSARNKTLLKKIFFLVVLWGTFGSVSSSAQAAVLYFSPVNPKVSVGNIISIKALVSTAGVAVNSADGVIQFPSDVLEVLSVNKSASIFSLWVEEPQFSNSKGTITFNGGLPNPGYIGQSGEIISVVFKAKKAGTASVLIADAAVRANDGLGTNVLTAQQPVSVQVSAAAQTDISTVHSLVDSVPAKPAVTSSTHPDQNAWYSGTTATFSWSVPEGVTSVQTLLSKNKSDVPTVTYDSSVSQRTVNNLSDGIMYFHVRYMNSLGWGPITHYKIQVDSTPPETLAVSFLGECGANIASADVAGAHIGDECLKNEVMLNARDTLSGIEYHLIKIDAGSVIRIDSDALVNGAYTLPIQNPGNHTLSVVAYDKAGNHTESKASFVSQSIAVPVVHVSAQEIQRGEAVTVFVDTRYANTPMQIFVQSGDGTKKSYTTTTDAHGSLSVTTDSLNTVGQTRISAQLQFATDVKSPISNEAVVFIKDGLIVRTSKQAIYGLSFLIPATLLIIGLILMLYLGWHKFFGLKKRLRKETQGTVNDIHKALSLYKDELGNQLKKLEKAKEDRELNKKEEKIFKELQLNIDVIDEFIEKKLKKII
ncbi:MAG: hypothetical protein PHG25_01330 [Candidatus Pacebacteria bacterium]|nr:hypothetical protein [Candidatus Paceibacterota bacterium]